MASSRTRRKTTPEEVESWVRLYEGGLSFASIASRVGAGRTTVQRHLKGRVHARPAGLRPRSLRILTQTESAYLAGIIDGEGSVVFSRDARRNRTTLRLVVANTNEELVAWLGSLAGTIRWYLPKRGRLMMGHWTVSVKADLIPLLLAVEPYSIIKKRLVIKALDFLGVKEVGDGGREGGSEDDRCGSEGG